MLNIQTVIKNERQISYKQVFIETFMLLPIDKRAVLKLMTPSGVERIILVELL